jgi:hypothetical protein
MIQWTYYTYEGENNGKEKERKVSRDYGQLCPQPKVYAVRGSPDKA